MADNITLKYASGAEVTISTKEDASVVPFVHTINVNSNISDGTTDLVINADGSINTQTQGTIDTDNSSTTPLSGGASFTGEWTNITNWGVIFVNVYSDAASATDGLMIQQSSDGVNADHDDVFTIAAATGKNFSINAHSKYYRIVYTNGAGAQSVFRLQAKLNITARPSSHRIQDSISDDDDAELVKSVLTGQDNTGTFKNVQTTVDGNLSISDNSSGLAIAQGLVTGVSAIQKFGNAPNFDTADGAVTVWDGAEDGAAWELMNYVYSTTADIDSISSSSAADTHDITIIGLDANYAEVTQTITLNGQTRVALSTNLIRVYRAYNANSTNLAGNVFIFVNGTTTGGVPDTNADIRAIVDSGNQQTEMAIYTIPAGKTGYLTRGYASTAGASKDANYVIRFFSRELGKVFRLQNINAISDTSSSIIVLDYFVPLRIPEKTDLEVTVEMTATGATGASISAGFDIVLIDD